MGLPAFHLTDLSRRVLGAPMAGGPSIPELVAEVSAAGGLGMLAAGYLTAEAAVAEVHRTRELGCGLFGVNLFLTDLTDSERAVEGRKADLVAYAERVAAEAAVLGVEIPDRPAFTDNDHASKVEALVVGGGGEGVGSGPFGGSAGDVVAALGDGTPERV